MKFGRKLKEEGNGKKKEEERKIRKKEKNRREEKGRKQSEKKRKAIWKRKENEIVEDIFGQMATCFKLFFFNYNI